MENFFVDGTGNLFSLARNMFNGGICYKEGVVNRPLKDCGPFTLFMSKEGADYTLRILTTGFNTGLRGFLYITKKCRYKLSKEDSVWCQKDRKSVRKLEEDNGHFLLPGETVLADVIIILPE